MDIYRTQKTKLVKNSDKVGDFISEIITNAESKQIPKDDFMSQFSNELERNESNNFILGSKVSLLSNREKHVKSKQADNANLQERR